MRIELQNRNPIVTRGVGQYGIARHTVFTPQQYHEFAMVQERVIATAQGREGLFRPGARQHQLGERVNSDGVRIGIQLVVVQFNVPRRVNEPAGSKPGPTHVGHRGFVWDRENDDR